MTHASRFLTPPRHTQLAQFFCIGPATRCGARASAEAWRAAAYGSHRTGGWCCHHSGAGDRPGDALFPPWPTGIAPAAPHGDARAGWPEASGRPRRRPAARATLERDFRVRSRTPTHTTCRAETLLAQDACKRGAGARGALSS